MRRRFVLACLGTASLTVMMINIPGDLSAEQPWMRCAAPASAASAANRLDLHRFPASAQHRAVRRPPRWPAIAPAQLRRAYNIAPLLRKGLTGAGQTIAIVDPFGSPTIEHDLQRVRPDLGPA